HQLSAGQRTHRDANERFGPQDRPALRLEHDWRSSGLSRRLLSPDPLTGKPVGAFPADCDECAALSRYDPFATGAREDQKPVATGTFGLGFYCRGVPVLYTTLPRAGADRVRGGQSPGTERDQGSYI